MATPFTVDNVKKVDFDKCKTGAEPGIVMEEVVELNNFSANEASKKLYCSVVDYLSEIKEPFQLFFGAIPLCEEQNGVEKEPCYEKDKKQQAFYGNDGDGDNIKLSVYALDQLKKEYVRCCQSKEKNIDGLIVLATTLSTIEYALQITDYLSVTVKEKHSQIQVVPSGNTSDDKSPWDMEMSIILYMAFSLLGKTFLVFFLMLKIVLS